MSTQPIVVFTDGASKRNPGPGGWGVVIVRPDGHVTELGGGSPMTTNNRMELTGAIEALSHLEQVEGTVEVYTDSTYVIQGIREWIHGWKRRGWKTSTGGDVLNREYWEALHELTTARGPRAITWHHVRGHAGIPGNERVDTIADAFATGKPLALYDGPLARYSVADVLDVPSAPAAARASKSTPGSASSAHRSGSSRAAAYTYLSVVDGVPMRHFNWAACEARVKGRAGAKYRKSTSPLDEAAILRSWGIDPSKV
jgi:ribonuclease HI